MHKAQIEIEKIPAHLAKPPSSLTAEIPAQRKAGNVALGFLARREHARRELYQKLITKGFDTEVVNHTLDDLRDQGYQSDERFTEMFIRSRTKAGDGPFKIKIALRSKGVCDSLVLAVLDKLNIDWFERIRAIQQKRFGQKPPVNVNEMAKQIHYLKNKGFCQEHINAVITYPHEVPFS